VRRSFDGAYRPDRNSRRPTRFLVSSPDFLVRLRTEAICYPRSKTELAGSGRCFLTYRRRVRAGAAGCATSIRPIHPTVDDGNLANAALRVIRQSEHGYVATGGCDTGKKQLADETALPSRYSDPKFDCTATTNVSSCPVHCTVTKPKLPVTLGDCVTEKLNCLRPLPAGHLIETGTPTKEIAIPESSIGTEPARLIVVVGRGGRRKRPSRNTPGRWISGSSENRQLTPVRRAAPSPL